MNLHQLPFMRTVLIPIINSNSRKIWFTGRWKYRKKRERKKNNFFYSSPMSSEKKEREKVK
jgi:hypothetical protein